MFVSLALSILLSSSVVRGVAVPRSPSATELVAVERRQFNESFLFDPSNFTAATVRAAPPNWPSPILNTNWTGHSYDLNATVEYGISLIKSAAAQGAGLIAFPECWFPGYPKGYDEGDNGGWMITHAPDYIANSLELGSYEWNNLVRAIKNAKIYVALGFSEKYEDRIYMGQALISPEGEKLIHRHKLRPSGSERDLWSDGLTTGLHVVDTPYGRWGMLECWEHFHPAMTYNMLAQGEDLHIGAWPFTPDEGTDDLVWRSGEVNMAAARVYATNSYAFTVVPTVGNSKFFANGGQVIAEVKASVPYDEQPLLFASVNTTAFAKTPYNSNGEQSWAILEQINDSFPSYIPHERGTFVPHRNISTAAIIAASEAYKAAH